MLFLGILGAHRFYLGKMGTGIIYLLTGRLFGIGWIVDLFTLGNQVDVYNVLKGNKNNSQQNQTVVVNVTAPIAQPVNTAPVQADQTEDKETVRS